MAAITGKNSKKVNDKQKKRNENKEELAKDRTWKVFGALQKIEPEKLLESLTINVFNLKKKKGGCRVKLRARLDGGGKDLLYSTPPPSPSIQTDHKCL